MPVSKRSVYYCGATMVSGWLNFDKVIVRITPSGSVAVTLPVSMASVRNSKELPALLESNRAFRVLYFVPKAYCNE